MGNGRDVSDREVGRILAADGSVLKVVEKPFGFTPRDQPVPTEKPDAG